ncbi:acyl-CoA reductase [Marivirga tractuosa]|uniref:Acyl-CoA reductase n=1 Tax=Marivirga tractuosa (strain ATCC 23168 / DSM 4126 / NBRC 15989 / NCIMB 1408 / VKM B-1430 / H-43) TaxID=643867 RepID=E4TVK5_MARTH|nr:acyl-CoA reductase [Marivirga tractuosa]ADR21118.1 acyl-CoA reductase [Marivirga tractuosa DSM 4126]BDD14427.1 acyl-CoA reductase [Marivirga tractuosa]
MHLQQRLDAFKKLGTQLRTLNEQELDEWYFRATAHNNWFTRENVVHAVKALGNMLDADKLEKWVSDYDLAENSDKKVAIIMAGNIPLVGFHDFLSVLISGHKVLGKLSSQDPYLLKEVVKLLLEIEPDFENKIELTQETISGFDGVIATGSNNSARYFEQYFGKYPNIIRKNRSSVAVLTGKETEEEIQALGKDIFQYYGLGCRNVSKLLVPEGFDFSPFIKVLEDFKWVADHHKWVNNYDYNKSIYLVNDEPHLDSGFFLMKEDEALVSPISVLFYEFYKSDEELEEKLSKQKEQIQCVVQQGAEIEPGKAQQPELWDYADGVDTLQFLSELN